MKKFIGTMLLLALTSLSYAHDGDYLIKKECVNNSEGPTCFLVGERIDVIFDIRAEDVGKKGGLYVAVQTENGDIQFLTPSGWTDGMNAYNYLELLPVLPGQKRATILNWEKSPGASAEGVDLSRSICAIAGKYGVHTIELWVGYGAVQKEAEEMIENYESIVVKEKPENHFRIVYAFEDGRKNNKYGQVIKFQCNATNGSPEWPVGAALATSINQPQRDFYSNRY